MANAIKFLNHSDLDIVRPVPAQTLIPEWYKNTHSYQNDEKLSRYVDGQKQTTATIKKCMPVFDVLTAGYFILTHEDIEIKKENGGTSFLATNSFFAHTAEQARLHPAVKSTDNILGKYVHSWGIETPVGYSCLFLPPVHRSNVISILPAVVDTDTYNIPVQLPFILADDEFQGVIPAGTPIAQVIPFQREDWEIEYTKADITLTQKIYSYINETIFNAYKNRFWVKKDFS